MILEINYLDVGDGKKVRDFNLFGIVSWGFFKFSNESMFIILFTIILGLVTRFFIFFSYGIWIFYF